ncbi:MAG TPA: protoporphyrinogen oxidase [Actinomycetota bacterium]|nr:protoporphyrinogen oxidase [Actinomycetota bacterium]
MSGRAVVVGGGVAGLATAHRLLRADPSIDLTVFESEPRVGGRLATAEVGGLELDAGPDSFVARKPWAVELCRELGLELVEPGARAAFAWTDHGLEPLPPSALGVPALVGELLRWPGLSRAGRLRAIADLVRKPRKDPADESLGALLRRRLGDEATERLVAPLLGGLFAGDVDRLDVRSTFPELERWEQAYGSLIRGSKAALEAAGDAGPMFVRPADGAAALPGALLAAIGAERVRTGIQVLAVEPRGITNVVRSNAGDLEAEGVVVATPAFVAAELVTAAAPLRSIPYVSTSVVLLVYPEGTGNVLPDATGFVVPSGAAPMTAATFLSRKWPNPAFGDRAIVRCFVGASGSEDVLAAPDGDIVEAVARHLEAVVDLPERPETSRVVRWPRSMPQYEVGHADRVRAVAEALPPGIFVAGNAYGGVGVADAVRSANEAAERASAHLAGDRTTTEPR